MQGINIYYWPDGSWIKADDVSDIDLYCASTGSYEYARAIVMVPETEDVDEYIEEKVRELLGIGA